MMNFFPCSFRLECLFPQRELVLSHPTGHLIPISIASSRHSFIIYPISSVFLTSSFLLLLLFSLQIYLSLSSWRKISHFICFPLKLLHSVIPLPIYSKLFEREHELCVLFPHLFSRILPVGVGPTFPLKILWKGHCWSPSCETDWLLLSLLLPGPASLGSLSQNSLTSCARDPVVFWFFSLSDPLLLIFVKSCFSSPSCHGFSDFCSRPSFLYL